jgi:hypothetical protein
MHHSQKHNTIIEQIATVSLGITWVLATAVSGIVGWAGTTLVGMGTLGCGMVLVGIIVGSCVGLAQGVVLWFYISWFRGRQQLAEFTANIFKLGAPGETHHPAIDASAFIIAWTGSTILGMHLCLAAAAMGWPGLANIAQS